MFAGTFCHLNADDKDHLVIEALSTAALTTSEIDGEILDRAIICSAASWLGHRSAACKAS
jgi:hypothetical protein